MTSLVTIDIFYQNYYRLNTEAVQGYLNAELGGIPNVPMIHTYSPTTLATTPLVAMCKNAGTIDTQGKAYTLKRFLSVQCFNDDFFKDEDGEFRPTVKPHYAIEPINGTGSRYDEDCLTLLHESGRILENRALNVHVHDNLLSPPITISKLMERFCAARNPAESLWFESYVVDKRKQQILITQHCLLNSDDYNRLQLWFQNNDDHSLDALLTKENPIQTAVNKFQKGAANENLCLEAIFSGADRLVAKPPHNEMEIIKPSTDRTQPSSQQHLPRQVSSSFLLEVLSKTAPVLGVLLVCACAVALCLPLGIPTLGAGLLGAGAIGGGLMMGLGLWGQYKLSPKEKNGSVGFLVDRIIHKFRTPVDQEIVAEKAFQF